MQRWPWEWTCRNIATDTSAWLWNIMKNKHFLLSSAYFPISGAVEWDTRIEWHDYLSAKKIQEYKQIKYVHIHVSLKVVQTLPTVLPKNGKNLGFSSYFNNLFVVKSYHSCNDMNYFLCSAAVNFYKCLYLMENIPFPQPRDYILNISKNQPSRTLHEQKIIVIVII